MNRLWMLLSAVLLAGAPSAVQAQHWTIGDQGANWSVLSDKPTGSAPADAYEPEEPPLPEGVVTSDWLKETADQLQMWNIGDPSTSPYIIGATPEAKALREKKFRTTCEPAPPAKRKDNILGHGIERFGHFHLGSGGVDWDENSDYTSLRENPISSCAGGPLNATNYMEPALLTTNPKTDAEVVVLPQHQTFYYVEGYQDEPNEATWLRRGITFIPGANPMNYNDGARRAAYEDAGLLYPGGPDTPAGFQGWICTVDGVNLTVSREASRMKTNYGTYTSEYSRHLKAEDGSDPWGGACVGTEAAPAEITGALRAPECWDRYNLHAPDGRAHFWYAADKADSSVKGACPTTSNGEGYARVPALQVKSFYETTGFSDYGEWHLASDRMPPSLTVTAGCTNDPETQGDPCSKDPCRQIGPYFCNGATLHADYTFGWDTTDVFDQLERECLGIPVRGIEPVNGPAECNSSQVDRYHLLEYGARPIRPGRTGVRIF